jgi:hypothetical protein
MSFCSNIPKILNKAMRPKAISIKCLNRSLNKWNFWVWKNTKNMGQYLNTLTNGWCFTTKKIRSFRTIIQNLSIPSIQFFPSYQTYQKTHKNKYKSKKPTFKNH